LAEYLYAIVASISHIDITTAIDGNTDEDKELTVPRTEATESGLEDTTGVESLYAIVARISHIDITTATDGDTVGETELTVPRT
jgi:alpha-D-ribose 1-methylphosphonate 5-phosphate C-P lyase